MNRDLQICLNILESGSVNEDSFKSLLQNFLIFTQKTENIAGNREDVAQVFCRILSECQKIYKITSPDKLPADIKEQIISSYNNIERLYVETNDEERNGSYVRTVWFLSELKSKSSEGRTGEIDHTMLGEYAKDLLDILGDIQFIFDIENEKGLIFPINKVIAAVIGGRDFQEFRDGVKKEDIYTLQLAVRLFRAAEDENILTTLKTRYHLAFIDYLNDYCEIIDTVDFLNYQRNGTMIFFNERARKVLIRSEREGYFSGCESLEYDVIGELDCNGNSIGLVKLFEDTYRQVARDKRVCKTNDLDSQIYLRILHNIIWSGVDSEEKKNTYFDIVFAHQIADYEGIGQDATFLRKEDTVLYVPKDSDSQDSVLSKLYGEYLKPIGRDPKHLYYNELTKNENDQYLVNENVISRVILLTDNIVSGTSTIHTIAAYMGIPSGSDRRLCKERLDKANASRQKYLYKGREVSIKTILDNNQVEFSVYSYYGTEKGIKKIEDFLEKHNIASSGNKYAVGLTKKADQFIIDKATSIWDECELRDSHYLYIRKYNMPKKSIFPPQMLDNPELFINVFYRNKELYDM